MIEPVPGSLAFTWWGHAATTVELEGARVAVDPLLVDRLFHLRRYGARPRVDASDADVVLVSHLHPDHLHMPSLRQFGRDVPVVVPRGAESFLADLGAQRLVAAEPGEVLDVNGVTITVLGATHDGRRHRLSHLRAPAMGFRVAAAGRSFWYPGDTDLRDDMNAVERVDLALAPVGGWGPRLGDGHMGPEEAAIAVARVGATWATPVHWGTFWPVGLAALEWATRRRLFATPGPRFADALTRLGGGAAALIAVHGERVLL